MTLNSTALSPLNISEIHSLCQHYLDITYQRSTPSYNRNHPYPLTETQGEILYPSVNKLMSAIKLTEQDVFIDLGSAAGKIVTQVFLTSQVKEAIGIEIIPGLHKRAVLAAEQIKQDLPGFFVHGRKLTFLQGNFLEIPFGTATIALVSALCFGPVILRQLSDIINQMPNIHTVLTLRPLPALQHLSFKKTIRIECSWDTALCYVYRKT